MMKKVDEKLFCDKCHNPIKLGEITITDGTITYCTKCWNNWKQPHTPKDLTKPPENKTPLKEPHFLVEDDIPTTENTNKPHKKKYQHHLTNSVCTSPFFFAHSSPPHLSLYPPLCMACRGVKQALQI